MTNLPVDFRKAPWKPKYLTEETPVLNGWIKFGTHEDGTVDISDANMDIFTHVPEEIADEIINARNEFCAVIEKHLCNFGAKT